MTSRLPILAVQINIFAGFAPEKCAIVVILFTDDEPSIMEFTLPQSAKCAYPVFVKREKKLDLAWLGVQNLGEWFASTALVCVLQDWKLMTLDPRNIHTQFSILEARDVDEQIFAFGGMQRALTQVSIRLLC